MEGKFFFPNDRNVDTPIESIGNTSKKCFLEFMMLTSLVSKFLDCTIYLVREYVEMAENTGDGFLARWIGKIKVSNYPLCQPKTI